MIEITRQLVETYGPSGREEQIREVIRGLVEPLADSIQVDALGNLIATLEGDGSGRRVMLAAHMDEIGVIVTHIDKEGFLRFGPVGGVRPMLCVGNRVRFENGVVGVIGVEKLDKPNAVPSFDQLYIDVGARDREGCPVPVGAMGGFDRAFVARDGRWTAKSMDDRIGCVVLIETLRALREGEGTIPHTVHFVFSVQEEVGTRGATTAAYHLDPEIGIAVDVTGTGDTPKARPMAVSLGAGAAIKVKDGGMISHPGLVSLMVERAEGAGIPYQLEVLTGGTTDARAMQLVHGGVISGCVSVPCRYAHTVSETVDAGDVAASVRLLSACLKDSLPL